MGRIQMQRGSVRQAPPGIYAGFVDSGEVTEESCRECKHVLFFYLGVIVLGLGIQWVSSVWTMIQPYLKD